MRKLTIYRRYFYNSKCYKESPTQTQKGIQVHNTSSNPTLKRWVQPDDGRIGHNQYGNSHNDPKGTVCASAYIGKQSDGTVAVYQVLPWDKRCWLSGSGSKGNANHFMSGFEIACDSNTYDPLYFADAVMDKAVLLCAYLCDLYGIQPAIKENPAGFGVMSHRELHDAGYASNHGDIDDWLRRFGYNMGDFRRAVISAMEEGVEVTYVDCDEEGPTLFEATITCTNKWLNLRSEPKTMATVIAQMPKGALVSVLEEYDDKWWKVKYFDTVGYAMHYSNDGAEWITREATEPIPGDPDEDFDDEEPAGPPPYDEELFLIYRECKEHVAKLESELSALKTKLEILEHYI